MDVDMTTAWMHDAAEGLMYDEGAVPADVQDNWPAGGSGAEPAGLAIYRAGGR